MQPEKQIEPLKELEEEKPELINVVKQPLGDEAVDTKVYSPDELDAAQHEAESKANELIANAELEEINEKGINASNDDPYFHPNTDSGHLFGWVFGDKTIQAPNHRIRRIILGLIVVAAIVGFVILKQHEGNNAAKKFTQQFPNLNNSNSQ